MQGNSEGALTASMLRAKPVYLMVFGLLLWGIQLTFTFGAWAGFHPGMGTIVGYVLLYIIPGCLSFALLNQADRWSRVQFLVLGFGIGVAEALLLGQVLVLLQAPVSWLAVAITGLTALKGIFWFRRTRGERVISLISGRFDAASLLQVVLVGLVLFTMLSNLTSYTTYSSRPTDSWNYSRVKVQFVESPFNYPYENDIVAHGINKRLFINSWLYNQAMMVGLLDGEVIEAQQRDSLFPVYIMVILIYAALGREISRDKQAAWLMAFLQIGFVLVASGSNYTERVSEDKFFSYFAFIPIIYITLLRYLRNTEKQDLGLLAFLSLAAGLLHPINPLMLFATIIPVLGYRALVLRRWQQIKAFVPVAVILAVLLLIPLVVQFAYADAVQDDEIVEDLLAESRDVSWDYTLEITWGYMWSRTDYHIFYGLLLTVILYWSWRAKDPLPYQFVFATAVTILLLLWVPPFAAIGVKVLTQSQNWRIFMLMPAGYGFGLVCWQLFGYLKRRLEHHPRFSETALRVIWGVGVVLLMNYGFEWTRNVYTKDPNEDMLIDAEQAAFRDNVAVIGDSRVLASYKLSQAIPILWPHASTPFAERANVDMALSRTLQEVLLMEGGHDANALIHADEIEYLLLSHETPLRGVVDYSWPCCERVYANDVVVLYRVIYDVPYGAVDESEIEHPLAVQFNGIAALRGANVHLQGHYLQINLYWEALAQSEQVYTGFVHLMGAFNPATGGPLWAQDDHLPALGQVSPESWALDRLYRDPYRLDLSGLVPGDYMVAVGLYDSLTHERLMIDAGEEDSYLLLNVTVAADGTIQFQVVD